MENSGYRKSWEHEYTEEEMAWVEAAMLTDPNFPDYMEMFPPTLVEKICTIWPGQLKRLKEIAQKFPEKAKYVLVILNAMDSKEDVDDPNIKYVDPSNINNLYNQPSKQMENPRALYDVPLIVTDPTSKFNKNETTTSGKSNEGGGFVKKLSSGAFIPLDDDPIPNNYSPQNPQNPNGFSSYAILAGIAFAIQLIVTIICIIFYK